MKTNGAGAAGSINARISGATVTVNDPVAPKLDRIHPTGLAAGGVVGGDEALTFDASDNAGIKRAELLDLTAGGQVVGTKEFACDYSYAAPCPQATGAQLTPKLVGVGARSVRLRVTDTAGNVTEGEPFAVTVGGPLNGTNATAAAKLSVTFARNRRSRIDVGFGKRAGIRGRLTNADGAPITGATLQVLDRELRTGTRYAQRLEVTTDADGRFSVLPGRGAARVIRFEYRSRTRLASPNVADSVSCAWRRARRCASAHAWCVRAAASVSAAACAGSRSHARASWSTCRPSKAASGGRSRRPGPAAARASARATGSCGPGAAARS